MQRKTTSILLCLDLEKGSRELALFCADCAGRWGYRVHVIHAHGEGGGLLRIWRPSSEALRTRH